MRKAFLASYVRRWLIHLRRQILADIFTARGPIWVRNVTCSGQEKQLSDCAYEELSSNRKEWYENIDEKKFCSYARQAAVWCKSAPQPKKRSVSRLYELCHVGLNRRLPNMHFAYLLPSHSILD